MNTAFCATCPYWHKAPADERPIPMGECRADPPKMFMFPVMVPPTQKVMIDQATAQQGGMTLIGQAAFPQVSADWWCGSHPAREIYDETLDGEQALG